MKKCCGNSIRDAFLAQQIEQAARDTGDCEYCGSRDVKLIDPPDSVEADLDFELFEALFGV